MSRRIMFVIIILGLLTSCAENKTEYYGTGEVWAKYQVVDDQKEGTETRYYPSGKLLSERYWKKGLLTDSIVHYYETGQVMEVQAIMQGLKQGLTAQYYPSGQKKLTANFIRDTMAGESVHYREDGTVELRQRFREGLLAYSYKRVF